MYLYNMYVINERLARRKWCDTTLLYGLLYGGFITCVVMYLVVAASKIHLCSLIRMIFLWRFLVYSHVLFLFCFVYIFKRLLREQNFMINFNCMPSFSYSTYHIAGTVLDVRNTKINTHCPQKVYRLMRKIDKPTGSYIIDNAVWQMPQQKWSQVVMKFCFIITLWIVVKLVFSSLRVFLQFVW